MSEAIHPLVDAVKRFFAQPQPEARRIFHGRGRQFPGLEHICLDWYSPLVLISAFEPIDEMDQLMEYLLAADQEKQIQSVVLQRRYEQGAPADCFFGEELDSITVIENGLQFEVHPGRRQNAGLFMDMRLVRQWLMENSRGRNVLNLFAYTCSLSVAALAGEASSVTSVDISKTSIAWGKRNHELNAQSSRSVRAIPYNLFTSWGRVKQYGRYDLVIIDPPTRQRGSFDVEKDYGAVVKRLNSLCNPGAEIIACLNSPFLKSPWMHTLFEEYCPVAEFVERLPVAPEYPDIEPERGLKIFRFRMTAQAESQRGSSE